MNDIELTPLQRAVAAQALYAALGPVVKAQGDGLRGQVDRELREAWEATGAKSYEVRAGGARLGTYSVVVAKAEPPREELVLDLEDAEALDAWLRTDEGREVAVEWAADEAEAFCRWVVDQGAVPPPGVRARVVEVPATPERYKGSQIRVDRAFQETARKSLMAGLPALAGRAALPEGA